MLANYLPAAHIQRVPQVADWQAALRLCAAPLLAGGFITPAYVDAIIATHGKIGPYYVLRRRLPSPTPARKMARCVRVWRCWCWSSRSLFTVWKMIRWIWYGCSARPTTRRTCRCSLRSPSYWTTPPPSPPSAPLKTRKLSPRLPRASDFLN